MYKCVALPIKSEEFKMEQCDLQQIGGGEWKTAYKCAKQQTLTVTQS